MNKFVFVKYLFFILIFVLFSCSRSARKRRYQNASNSGKLYKKNERIRAPRSGNNSIIQMEKKMGVYYIPITLNGIQMEFIFDTGASVITMSESDYIKLKNAGKISESDVKGKKDFEDANGDVSTGVILNIKKVKVGEFMLDNVEAAILSGANAPRLFGQSALSRFGKVSVDYTKNQIVINN